MAQLHLELRRPELRRVCAAFLCLGWLGALPAAAEEIHRWVDAQGREHFGNKRPAAAVAVESAAGGVVNQADSQQAESETPSGSEAIADRLNKLRQQNVAPSTTAKPDTTKHDEAWCQKTYGKSCKELDQWREKAIADCRERDLAHCDDPKWIEEQHPKPLEEIAKANEDKREYNAKRAAEESADDADGGDDGANPDADGAPDPTAPDAPPGEGPPPPADSGSGSEADADSDSSPDPDADADADDGEDSGDDQEQADDADSDHDHHDRASDRAAEGKRGIADNARRQTAKPRPPTRPRAAR